MASSDLDTDFSADEASREKTKRSPKLTAKAVAFKAATVSDAYQSPAENAFSFHEKSRESDEVDVDDLGEDSAPETPSLKLKIKLPPTPQPVQIKTPQTPKFSMVSFIFKFVYDLVWKLLSKF